MAFQTNDLRSQRFQLRLTPETYWRIKTLAHESNCSMARLIEKLVDDAWSPQFSSLFDKQSS